MNIEAVITNIEYQTKLNKTLKEVNLMALDINNSPPCFMLNMGSTRLAISKWVSPKRTRSYPYERVYNTLSKSKRITIIPVVKDEGMAGDRDFLQWDTIAMMSLLDVYVILAYYIDAEKRTTSSGKQKITKQKFDNNFIIKELKKVPNYHGSALHWNLKQIKSLPNIVRRVKSSYRMIAKKTGVELKSEKGLDNFLNKITEGMKVFMDFSRVKAEQAQRRELTTKQPKELLGILPKAKITIKNYLGGLYYFTVDEVELKNDELKLIESKHSATAKLPSEGDIKDGVFKMILYSNLENVTVNNQSYRTICILKLTALAMKGRLNSESSKSESDAFYKKNKISPNAVKFLNSLFEEARINNFKVILNGLT